VIKTIFKILSDLLPVVCLRRKDYNILLLMVFGSFDTYQFGLFSDFDTRVILKFRCLNYHMHGVELGFGLVLG